MFGQIMLQEAAGYLVPLALAAALGFLAGKLRRLRGIPSAIDEMTLMVCRLCIYDDHFSVDEKVDAYRTYRERGGNSKTKHYMDELLGGDADEYLAHHVR